MTDPFDSEDIKWCPIDNFTYPHAAEDYCNPCDGDAADQITSLEEDQNKPLYKGAPLTGHEHDFYSHICSNRIHQWSVPRQAFKVNQLTFAYSKFILWVNLYLLSTSGI